MRPDRLHHSSQPLKGKTRTPYVDCRVLDALSAGWGVEVEPDRFVALDLGSVRFAPFCRPFVFAVFFSHDTVRAGPAALRE